MHCKQNVHICWRSHKSRQFKNKNNASCSTAAAAMEESDKSRSRCPPDYSTGVYKVTGCHQQNFAQLQATGQKKKKDQTLTGILRGGRRGPLSGQRLLQLARLLRLLQRNAFLAKVLHIQHTGGFCSLRVLATCFRDGTLTS